ncbi:ribosome biogenesis GTP-binding protein YihA/YsxC [Campylobacter sp. CCUG 57310]|uniref:ribosome biogenesis GTP-binding protein YihA/YsxC n=1 Tax=Campylobacter sp. CCUG 57310 TaxID=2517362 RepID=UPI001565530E|nr:ribosome biogenesis GTP-binding protein YihA/YsxC [Campylobacter sp. CCUG 57310]QKF92521.1 ribosome biogenesis GTP-binding protein YsxC/EngB [Campylobacter sp. CCUG 57310]
MIRALNAKFLISAPNISLAPPVSGSEVAFLGRSNVGKSSLINALVNHKNLAKSSSTPGKTQLINFFEVGYEYDEQRINLVFVDLPGFGYARVAKSMHNEWKRNLDEYLKQRSNIKLFVHLIDSRHFDLEIDKNVNDYLQSFLRADQRILNILTKADKLNQSEKSAALKAYPNAHFVSVLKKIGIDKANELIVKNALGV